MDIYSAEAENAALLERAKTAGEPSILDVSTNFRIEDGSLVAERTRRQIGKIGVGPAVSIPRRHNENDRRTKTKKTQDS